MISSSTLDAWEKWIKFTKSRCHLHFKLEGNSISEHIEICLKSSKDTVDRVVKDLPNGFNPKRILEIGASVGLNSMAFAQHFENAAVYSVEPDTEAVEVADLMARDLSLNYTPISGTGEEIEFSDNYFDLVVCHTVIEHVESVPAVIVEMARVVSSDGFIHLEAPNYFWPYEPHLGVWCVPLLGKPLLRFFSWIQGKSRDNWYVEHLQFVTPFSLEKYFRKNNLIWENRVEQKLKGVVDGSSEIKCYRTASKAINLLSKFGFINIILFLVIKTGLYPSVLYSLKKNN